MSLLRFQENFKYVLVDTETESLNLKDSRPWQCAFLVCEGKRIVESHNLHLDIPNLNIGRDAARITGFSQDHHDRVKVPMEEAWEKFSKYLYDPEYRVVGHNILGFDVYMLNSWMREMGLKPDWSYIPRCIDTHCLAKAIHLGSKPPKDEKPIYWQYKMLSNVIRAKTNLKALGRHYDVDFDDDKLHDALEDIKLNQQIFLKQIYEIEIR